MKSTNRKTKFSAAELSLVNALGTKLFQDLAAADRKCDEEIRAVVPGFVDFGDPRSGLLLDIFARKDLNLAGGAEELLEHLRITRAHLYIELHNAQQKAAEERVAASVAATVKSKAKPHSSDASLEAIEALILDLGPAASTKNICDMLDQRNILRPKHAAWRHLTWRRALREHRGAVSTWVSKRRERSS